MRELANKLIPFLLIVPVLSVPLTAQGPVEQSSRQAHVISVGRPEQAGMSPAVVAGAVGLYREAVQRGDLVGAVLLVARHGRIVVHEALGLRDQEEQLPMERDTLFRMASNTKPVVATAVARLVEQGNVSYDDPVRKYVDGWDNYRSGFITIDHLLSHTSGLRIRSLFLQPLMKPSVEHPDAPTLPLEAARFGNVGAEVVPGTSFSYNNPGYNTLGALLEIVSGRLLEDQLRAEIYEPLGMNDSYNHRAGHELGGKLDRMGAVYYRRGEDGRWQPGGTPGGPVAYPFARASGGMVSTARDYLIFCQMFLNGGIYDGARILKPETVELMTTPHLPNGEAGNRGYGYGWSVRDGVYSHGGSDGTNAVVDPDRGLVVLVFTQTPRGENPLERFVELINLAIEEG